MYPMDDGKVCWIPQTRNGPASPGKQKTTLSVLKVQAREQVHRERQIPLLACSLEHTLGKITSRWSEGLYWCARSPRDCALWVHGWDNVTPDVPRYSAPLTN